MGTARNLMSMAQYTGNVNDLAKQKRKRRGNTSQKSPMYAKRTLTDRNGRPVVDKHGKPITKTMERPVPPGLPAKDVKILKQVRKRAHNWDMKWHVCGWHWGYSSVLGLLPGAGDALEVAFALSIALTCWRIKEVTAWTKFMMLWNIFLDFLIGLIPLVGDLVDISFKANVRNVWRLEAILEAKSEMLRSRRDIPTEALGDVEQGRQMVPPQGRPAVPQPAVMAPNRGVMPPPMQDMSMPMPMPMPEPMMTGTTAMAVGNNYPGRPLTPSNANRDPRDNRW